MDDYKNINEDVWRPFGKELLREKGSAQQDEFLQVCKSGNEFLQYLKQRLFSDNGVVGERLVEFDRCFPERLTENAFFNPPADVQMNIWNYFQTLPAETLYSCGFWGYVVVEMIKHGKIDPCFLAKNSDNDNGAIKIDKAIRSSDPKIKDDCVRRILRSLCNPAPRGERIVFYDFPLGKSYWNWHWAHTMGKLIALEAAQIRSVLNTRNYGIFAEKMHSQKSYISQRNTLGGLVLFLHENRERKNLELRKIVDQISFLSAWKAIELQSPDENKNEIAEIYKSMLQSHAGHATGEGE